MIARGSAGYSTMGLPHASDTPVPLSGRRPLRIFPFDPMLDRFGRSVIADVPYERVDPGPVGRLVEIIDYDATHDVFYTPVDLDSPEVLLNQGLDLAEADPRFHQQMTYAVVMRVLDAFETGLGRPLRWRGRKLRVFPHAFEDRNAYFDEDLFALCFGYFTADAHDPGPNLPGQRVFTCLSHDIVAHETAHAVLHRLRPNFSVPTNRDVLAFHEGFADIVAILQHFTYPTVVEEHIRQTSAKLTEPTPLLSLASQFGFASGGDRALRDALQSPDKNAYLDAEGEHELGSVLVAAVIDGFLRAYERAISDLLRIAVDGPVEIQPGALHPDLVSRIAGTASATAGRILDICVRAFDYLPPVDVTFGDYLRALVTADFDISPDDPLHLRSSLIEGFRARGIYSTGVVSLAEGSLRIVPADPDRFDPLPNVPERMLDAARDFDRARRARTAVVREDDGPSSASGTTDADLLEGVTAESSATWARRLNRWAVDHAEALQMAPGVKIQPAAFHTLQRTDALGYVRSNIAVQFVQRRPELRDEFGGIVPLGGTTVIADSRGVVEYVVGKPLPQDGSLALERLRSHVAAVEHKLQSPAWQRSPKTRLTDRLNLRALDDRRY